MLTIRLVTIEDEGAQAIYEPIYAQLEEWLFARRGIVGLHRPESASEHLVGNLEEWHALLPHLSGPDQLVFCTVDLAIPAAAGGSPDKKNGLAVVNEIRARQGEGWRCCILTGMESADLQRWLGEKIPEVLFEFKGDRSGYANIVNYIKSQCFPLIDTLTFTGHDGRTHQILLAEDTGRIRDHYLSKAPYYADASTWHVPTLIVGERGMGHRTFIEFVAYLSEATTEVIELALPEGATEAERLDHNEAVFERLQEILGALDGSSPRHLFFVNGLDRYQPEQDADEGYDCLGPLGAILERLRALGSRHEGGFPFGIIFSVSAESRLRIQSRATRGFVRLLEQTIAEMTDFPLHHLGLDENGWTLDHPRILRVPSLHDHGKPFIGRFIASQLARYRAELPERLPGYQGQPLTLSAGLLDFLADGTDWAEHGNIFGLARTLRNLFLNFLDNRANHQYQMTLAHLDADFRERFQRIVLNMDDVSLSFPDPTGKMQPVVKNADLKLHKGELLVILGPSGCGKSTILRMLSGLLAPTAGRVTYFQEPLLAPTEKIGFIFQDYSLFPWLTIRRNVEFGPRLRGGDRNRLVEKVNDLFEIAKLQDKENDYPRDLSGGQQQRAAIIRSLANDPDVLLMDEPFSALDVQTRWEMQRFLVDKVVPLGKSVAFVTHDIDEAVFVADRILVASPRPLVLCDEVRVPFSAQDRTDALRRDPVFVALVEQVRDSLLRAAAQMEDVGAAG